LNGSQEEDIQVILSQRRFDISEFRGRRVDDARREEKLESHGGAHHPA